MTKQHPILLLHGALGDANTMKPLARSLEEQGFNTHTLNFSGHGGAAFAESFGIARFVTETAQYIKKRKLGPVRIFGYSMGGYVALCLAAKEPSLVHSVMTLGTKFAWSPTSAAQEVKMLNPDKIEEKVPRFAMQLSERHEPNDWKEVMRKTKDMMLVLGDTPPLSETILSLIQQPALVCRGSEDAMVTEEESQKAASALENGSYHILPDVVHPIEKVQPAAIVEEAVRFFSMQNQEA